MTRVARGRHRATVTALAVALPTLLTLALTARPARPTPEPFPASLASHRPEGAASSGAFLPVGGPSGDAASDPGAWPLDTRMARSVAGPPWVELRADDELRLPDVLLYWTPASAFASGSTAAGLPEAAWLLGRVAGTAWQQFVLPAAAREVPGRLLLYSLGRQRVVAQLDLSSVDAGAR